MQLFNKEIVFV